MAHDAHAQPPGDLRAHFKKWQKAAVTIINDASAVLDTASLEHDVRVKPHEVPVKIREAFQQTCDDFTGCHATARPSEKFYEVDGLQGLFIYPSLLTIEVQVALLNKLLHRDLSNPRHSTNLHLHYQELEHQPDHEQLSLSWFDRAQEETIQPKDATVHKPLTMKQVLSKRLRWVTLGGQYDWTNKAYPDEVPPAFPADIAELLRGIFPDIEPQAAILNFYSPGDNLSLHRDVSEQCDEALISISIGCDALFMVANDDASTTATIRLKSGDVVLMSGKSRFAWHCVPKIIPDTCPEEIACWPAIAADTDNYEHWRKWLATKRINLNVRQMHAIPTLSDEQNS